jgi:Protein of unknown function (DUF5672)
MVDLKNTTIVSVACVRVIETLNAIKKSISGIDFYDAKLITSQDIFDDKVKTIKINNLDYEQYNKFIVYELHKYIETDYLLIVQDDGYVINPTQWRDDFFKYDYIGAPWAMPTDSFSCRDPFNNIIRVGNGGFSFRSKKLISLPSILNLEWKSYFGYFNEDGFFSVHNRHIFESHGCNFAPIDVAKYFSHETEMPETQGIVPFGFHGKWSKYNMNY